ncbi:hypothetical protein DFH11DRAFT_1643011 [Phellopilus nigrolimitatus]|nr:hypothetical protein DFH11DRAFT_1643011 [Phellopilus nigrolimitatus]
MSSGTGLPALDNTMGALFLGVIFAMGLWGAGTVQMYYYYDTYGKDELWIKMVVFSVWIFDTVHQGLITHSCYIYLITEYGNPLFLATLEKTLMIMVFFTACICFIVQTFFTMRIWRLSHKSVYLTGAVYIFVLTQLVSTLVYFGTAIHFKLFAELLAIKNLTRSINVVNAIADAAIAASLVFLLHKSRTGFRQSETILNRLILFTVNTGLITGLTAIVCLVMNLVFPTTFLYILFYLMTSRLYMNSLLATLNTRKSIRRGGLGDSAESTGPADISLGQFRAQQLDTDASSYNNRQKMSIKIDTETTREIDEGSEG